MARCCNLNYSTTRVRTSWQSQPYQGDYSIIYLGLADHHACSLALPIELFLPYHKSHWFSFLDDIMPAGASRRFWVNHLNLGHLAPTEQDFQLLKNGTIAPVGNIRIKEALPKKNLLIEELRFSIEDVVERNTDFLEYAQQRSAAAGGATGAGGEAPKLLLRLDAQQQVWIDPFQDELTNLDQHYLVKFPRGQRTPIDCDILRAEYHYYQLLAKFGLNTINTHLMQLMEGDRYPSLWLPRFDVHVQENQLEYLGLESIYSVLEQAPASFLNHFDIIPIRVDI